MNKKNLVILVLVLLGVIAAALFGVGVNFNKSGGGGDAKNFKPPQWAKSLGKITGPFSPKLEKVDIRQAPGQTLLFRISPSDDKFRKAEFCAENLLSDKSGQVIVDYACPNAEMDNAELRDQLKQQSCTLAVAVRQEPQCNSLSVLKEGGALRIVEIKGKVRVKLNGEAFRDFTEPPSQ